MAGYRPTLASTRPSRPSGPNLRATVGVVLRPWPVQPGTTHQDQAKQVFNSEERDEFRQFAVTYRRSSRTARRCSASRGPVTLPIRSRTCRAAPAAGGGPTSHERHFEVRRPSTARDMGRPLDPVADHGPTTHRAAWWPVPGDGGRRGRPLHSTYLSSRAQERVHLAWPRPVEVFRSAAISCTSGTSISWPRPVAGETPLCHGGGSAVGDVVHIGHHGRDRRCP